MLPCLSFFFLEEDFSDLFFERGDLGIEGENVLLFLRMGTPFALLIENLVLIRSLLQECRDLDISPFFMSTFLVLDVLDEFLVLGRFVGGKQVDK